MDLKAVCPLSTLEDTENLAKKIASNIKTGDSILLFGPLGVGKTSFARALIRSACKNKWMEVPSPSFTLVQIYDSPDFCLYHYDLWRLKSEEELLELDWDEAQENIVIVEWPERLGALMPKHALHVHFSIKPDKTRLAILSHWDERLKLLFNPQINQ
ncbi:tRNA threonylcarbamoyladenosine biosynthesis protein TsaE [Commensalibacter sp. Nvir]|uniref:tRNA (adenosine(37)-N6)-threonylcarbamoyltransferase complex ATPase subunit type 1 TsaE n=1 Tax=Commensalibacter sp. Nvir TaxID=3069817 RepID=UPI002D4DAA81|nr:tRNA threonylcarbamoyladenosine biosynthesis protein TsaE [Commensalibacter sp. Nvir]